MSDPFSQFKNANKPDTDADPFAEFESASKRDTAPPKSKVEAGSPVDPFAEFSASASTPEGTSYRDVEAEIEDRSAFDKPVLGAEYTSPDEIRAIADKFGVNTEWLMERAPYFGARIEGSSFASPEELKRAAGGLGSTFLLNLPQKAYKGLAATPNQERALDAVQELAAGRRSYVQVAGEVAAPGGTVAKEAGLAAKAASGATFGALGGLGASSQGEEKESLVAGATLGGVLGGALHGVEKILGRGRGRQAAVSGAAGRTLDVQEQIVDSVAKRGGIDFEAGVRKAVKEREAADDLIASYVFSRDQSLGQEAASTIARTYQPTALADLVDPSTEVGSSFLGKLRKSNPSVTPDEVQKAAERYVSDRVIQEATADLAQDVFKRSIPKSDDPLAMLRKWSGLSESSGQGVQYAQERLKALQNLRTAQQYLVANSVQDTAGLPFSQRALDFLSDGQYVFRDMDEKFKGLGAEAAHKKILRGLNRMSFPREEMRGQLRDIFRGLKKSGADKKAINGRDIIEQVERGSRSPEVDRVYSKFETFFSENLRRLNELAEKEGLPPLLIKPRPNYVPAQLRDTSELRDVMSDRISSILSDASTAVGRRLSDLSEVPDDVLRQVVRATPEHSDTLKFLHVLSGDLGNRPFELSNSYKQVFVNPDGRQRLETVARAALEREDLIPMWARETNLYKLADKWSTNSLRHLYLRRGIDDMRNVVGMLRTLRADGKADYAERLLADIMGTRKGTAAEYFSRSQDKYHAWIDKKVRGAPEGSPKRLALETAKAIPTMLQDMTKQVYPNMLGALNPRTLLMNMTQTVTKTMPELGPVYGPLTVFRGAARIGGIKGLKSTIERMEAMGLAPAEFVGGSLDYLADGITRSSGIQAVSGALRKSAELGMKPYQMAETVNRAIAFGTSEMMTADLFAGSKAAQKALRGLPTSVRRAVERAVTAGDQTTALRELSTHLVNNTQYQYNRAAMSEYGRTMGPLFSTFSKWPTATLGQAVEAYRTKGAVGGSVDVAQKLVAPWVLLQGADYLLGEGSDEGLSDRQKKLFGGSGLSQAAPIGNLGAIARGDFFTPPVIDTAARVFLDPANAKDSEDRANKFRKAFSNGVYQFAPGGIGGWVRLVTDDVATLITGERPEGSDFFERTAEGWKALD